jgi:hypothetical protein
MEIRHKIILLIEKYILSVKIQEFIVGNESRRHFNFFIFKLQKEIKTC